MPDRVPILASRFAPVHSYKHDEPLTKQQAVDHFREWLAKTPAGLDMAAAAREQLRGKDLACWCGLDQPCHADVLLEIANA